MLELLLTFVVVIIVNLISALLGATLIYFAWTWLLVPFGFPVISFMAFFGIVFIIIILASFFK